MAGLRLLLLAGALGAVWASSDLQASLQYLEDQGDDKYTAELLEFVSIPSVSSLPENANDILRAADYVLHRLVEAGLEVCPRSCSDDMPRRRCQAVGHPGGGGRTPGRRQEHLAPGLLPCQQHVGFASAER